MLNKLYYALHNILEPLIYARRVRITSSCDDANYIPKVTNAGSILIENDVKVQIMHNGVKVIAGGYHGTWMQKVITNLNGHHEPQEEHVFYQAMQVLGDDSTMLELGSFWAYYSLWFHKEVKNATNYLIEPNIKKIEIGKNNFKLNKFNGNFYNAFIGENSESNSLFTDWDKSKYKVEKICIDDFVNLHNIDTIDLLHSDIQGAEYDMLLGAEKALENHKIGLLFISTHGDKHDVCLKHLKDQGHKIIAEHTIAEGFAQEGLIVSADPIIHPNIETMSVTKRTS